MHKYIFTGQPIPTNDESNNASNDNIETEVNIASKNQTDTEQKTKPINQKTTIKTNKKQITASEKIWYKLDTTKSASK